MNTSQIALIGIDTAPSQNPYEVVVRPVLKALDTPVGRVAGLAVGTFIAYKYIPDLAIDTFGAALMGAHACPEKSWLPLFYPALAALPKYPKVFCVSAIVGGVVSLGKLFGATVVTAVAAAPAAKRSLQAIKNCF